MKLAFIAQPEYFSFIYDKGLEKLGEVKEFPFKFGMDESEYESLINYNADFNFFFRGEFVPNNILLKLEGINVNLSSEPFPSYYNGKINYTQDSLNRLKTFMTIHDKKFDYIFHYDKTTLDFLRKFGFKISGDFYFPVRLYEQDNYNTAKWDFFFIGRSTKRREDYFSFLKHHYIFLHICHGIWGDELYHFVKQSKIVLNIHAENEISWEPRVQQMMSMGKLVISEVISPNDLIVPGKDYISVNTPEELIKQAEYYLLHENERELIALHAKETIKRLFDNYVVFFNLINDIKTDKLLKQDIKYTKLMKFKFYASYYYLSIRHFLKTILIEVKKSRRKLYETLRNILSASKEYYSRWSFIKKE